MLMRPRGIRALRQVQTRKQGIRRALKNLKHKVSKISVSREIKELTALPHNTYGVYTQTGDTRVVPLIAQGDDYNNRVGRQIHPTSLAIDFFLRGPQSNTGAVGTFTAPVNPVPWRIIVVQDMAYNGSTKPLSQILEATSAVSGENDNYISGYNDDYVKVGKHSKDNPVKILMDKRGWFVGTATGYSDHIGKWVKCRISGSRLKSIQFAGTTTTDVRSGCIYYYVLLGADSNGNNNGSFLVRSTLRYYDD